MKYRINPRYDHYLVERKYNIFSKWEIATIVSLPKDNRYVSRDSLRLAKIAVKALKEVKQADAIIGKAK